MYIEWKIDGMEDARGEEVDETEAKQLGACHNGENGNLGVLECHDKPLHRPVHQISSLFQYSVPRDHGLIPGKKDARVGRDVFVCFACIFGQPHLREPTLGRGEPPRVVWLYGQE